MDVVALTSLDGATQQTILRAFVVAVGGLLAVATGNQVVQGVFCHVDADHLRSQGQPRGPRLTVAAGDALPGGRWIGPLERVAVFVSVVGGWPEGIAIVLAVKGLARYPELSATTPGAAERFIIGTFVSVLYAAAWAGGTAWLSGVIAP